jgi:acyl-CoA thioesterase I
MATKNITRLFSFSGIHSACMKSTIITLLLVLVGCGGSVQQQPQVKAQAVAVTFYGDSLTQFWQLDQSFPGKPYTNDGHFGFTAVTLASDFDSSVLPTHPGAVMILAGTNDVLQGDTAAHIFTVLTGMYGQARTDGIPFVVCTLPPMAAAAGASHNAVIVDLNSQLRAYAVANKLPLADYYAALVDPASGELQAVFSVDNVHLTAAGYAAIAPVASRAIATFN